MVAAKGKIMLDLPTQHKLGILQGIVVEMDYLIYNDPLGYADLILNGGPEDYLKKVTGSHGVED